MYFVESDTSERSFTVRRKAWSYARVLAKQGERAVLYDGLMIEPPVYFELDGDQLKVCRCTAEARLLRAIFADAHPSSCEESTLANLLAGRGLRA